MTVENGLAQDFIDRVQKGSEKDDLLVGRSPGNDFLIGNGGNDTLVAGGGESTAVVPPVDTVVAPPVTTPVVESPPNPIIGFVGDDNLTGTDGRDIVVDLAGNDTISTGNGNDFVFGGDGNDAITGGVGLDTLFGGSGDDRLIWNNGDGTDVIDGGTGSSDVSQINGAAAGDVFTLSERNGDASLGRTNLKSFNMAHDGVEQIEVNGGTGDDSLTVADLLGTDVTSVAFNGGEGADILNGAASTVQILGNGDIGNDVLTGGLADDIFNGGEGDDILTGGLGNDTLTGGAGLDRFLFDSGTAFGIGNPGIDTLADFNRAEDKFVLDKTTFGSIQSMDGEGFSVGTEFASVGSEAEIETSDALIVAVRGINASGKEVTNLFYNANGAEAGLGVGGQFAAIDGQPELSAQNFVLQA